MSKGNNSKKDTFIRTFPQKSLHDTDIDIGDRGKFNFSYFNNSQRYAQDLATWDETNLRELFVKLKEFSRESLLHWTHTKNGGRRTHVLEVYGAFPKSSDFTHPSDIPSDADWARFRLAGKKRLIGFLIPRDICDSTNNFDNNTFYVVFMDPAHRFYTSKK